MMINKTKINYIILNNDAKCPSYGTGFAAGADLYSADEDTTVSPGETAFIHTGLAMEIPEGLVGLIYARSGLACKQGLAPANKVGVIDSDYRGEIIVALHNHSDNAVNVAKHDRVAQIVFAPYYFAEFNEVDALEETDRGAGGFGSTGRK